MAYTHDPPTASIPVGYQDALETVRAVNLRRAVTGLAALTEPVQVAATGVLANSAVKLSWWQGLHDSVVLEGTWPWVRTHSLSGVAYEPSDYATTLDGEFPLWTLDDALAVAGIPDGVRRLNQHDAKPSDWNDYSDAAWSYGPPQAGDVPGPWILEDLRKLIALQRRILASSVVLHVRSRKFGSGSSARSDWTPQQNFDKALADAQAAWAAAGAVGAGATCYAANTGLSYSFNVQAQRATFYVTASVAANPAASTWYAYVRTNMPGWPAAADDRTFDVMGDIGGATAGGVLIAETISVAQGTLTATTADIGDAGLAFPTAVAMPATSAARGYQPSAVAVLVDYGAP